MQSRHQHCILADQAVLTSSGAAWGNVTGPAAAVNDTGLVCKSFCLTGIMLHAGQTAACGCEYWPSKRLLLWLEQGEQRMLHPPEDDGSDFAVMR